MNDAPLSRRALALAAAGLATGCAAAAPARNVPARAELQALTDGDWLTQVRAQHRAIHQAFERLLAVDGIYLSDRRAALDAVANLLTGHAIAEEIAIYPFHQLLTLRRPATDQLYDEQRETKIMLAAMQNVNLAATDFEAGVAELRDAVTAHFDLEERELQSLAAALGETGNTRLSTDFRREFLKYVA